MLAYVRYVEGRPGCKVIMSNGIEPGRLDWAKTRCMKECNMVANSMLDACGIVDLIGSFERGGDCP